MGGAFARRADAEAPGNAPVAVVAVEETALLQAMHAIISRIEIEDQLGRRGFEACDELLDEHARKSPSRLPVGAIFGAATKSGSKRAPHRARSRSARPDRCAKYRLAHLPAPLFPSPSSMVIEILVAARQPIDTLAQKIELSVGDQVRVARIGPAKPTRRSAWRSSIPPPSLETSPPEKLASILRRSKLGKTKSLSLQFWH